MQSEQINELAAALAAAQGEIEDPHKTKTGTVKGETKAGKPYSYDYKYADIADVLKNVRSSLSKHGIAVTQPTVLDGSTLLIRTQLSHSSGQWMASDYPVCSIQGDHQKMGAAMTYARRYALTSIVGVAADDDTDGQGAAESMAPKNGGWSNKAPPKRTQAEISAQKVAKESLHDEFVADLADANTLHALEKLEDAWAEKLKGGGAHAWTMAERLESKRRELSAPVEEEESGPILDWPTKAEFVQHCHALIDRFGDEKLLLEWWNHSEQKAARKRYRLTPDEVTDLRRRVMERRAELTGGVSGVPEPRQQTILDAG